MTVQVKQFLRPVEILLVEDNPGDARLTMEALKEGRIANFLHHVSDGQTALDFLHRRNGYHDAPRPDMVLLDLNLPCRSGHEVLAEIKETEYLTTIPVCVLSTSNDTEEINRSYENRADCYLTKPESLEDLTIALRQLEAFWFSARAQPKKTLG